MQCNTFDDPPEHSGNPPPFVPDFGFEDSTSTVFPATSDAPPIVTELPAPPTATTLPGAIDGGLPPEVSSSFTTPSSSAAPASGAPTDLDSTSPTDASERSGTSADPASSSRDVSGNATSSPTASSATIDSATAEISVGNTSNRDSDIEHDASTPSDAGTRDAGD